MFLLMLGEEGAHSHLQNILPLLPFHFLQRAKKENKFQTVWLHFPSSLVDKTISFFHRFLFLYSLEGSLGYCNMSSPPGRI